MGGLEAMNEIRQIDPEVKAIVSSGYSVDPVMAHFHEYGFKAAINKPFRLSELEETIRSVIA